MLTTSEDEIRAAMALLLEPALPLRRNGALNSMLRKRAWLVQRAELLQRAADQFIAEAHARIVATRKQINQLIPVATLPVELLIDIIQRAAGSGPKRNRRLMQLATVAADWWHAIDTSPILWTLLHPGDLTELAILKSQISPLDIQCKLSAGSDSLDNSIPMESFVNAVGPHRRRWKSLNVEGPVALIHMLPSIRSTNLHQLETFKLTLPPRPNQVVAEPIVHFIGGPHLRRIQLAGVELHWDSGALSKLRSLSIMETWGPSLHRMLSILAGCPELEDLRLVRLRADPSATLLSNLTPVHLHRLKKLEIISCGWTDEFLRNIRANNLTLLRAKPLATLRDSLPQLLKALTDPAYDHLRKVADNTGVRSVAVDVWVNALCIEGWADGGKAFKISADGHWLRKLKDLAPNIPFASSNLPLRLSFKPRNDRAQASASFLGAMSAVVSLDIGVNLCLQDLPHFLSQPELLPDDTVRWPCPKLSIVLLGQQNNPLPDVAEMTKTRKLATKNLSAGLEDMIVCNTEFQVLNDETLEFEHCGATEWVLDQLNK